MMVRAATIVVVFVVVKEFITSFSVDLLLLLWSCKVEWTLHYICTRVLRIFETGNAQTESKEMYSA